MELLDNTYFLATMKVIMIVYASIFAPRLPDKVVNVLQTTPVKIVFVAAVAFSALRDIQMSLLIACAFVLSINVLSGRSILESYANINSVYNGKKNPQELIEPNFFVYPGCVNIKKADLISFFDEDQHKLQKTVHYVFKEYAQKLEKTDSEKAILTYARYAGLPHNVAINDKNAPLIATMLLQYGYKLSESCKVPQ